MPCMRFAGSPHWQSLLLDRRPSTPEPAASSGPNTAAGSGNPPTPEETGRALDCRTQEPSARCSWIHRIPTYCWQGPVELITTKAGRAGSSAALTGEKYGARYWLPDQNPAPRASPGLKTI